MPEIAAELPSDGAEPEAMPVAGATLEESRQVRYREHGPYAAHLCNACHDPNAFNALRRTTFS